MHAMLRQSAGYRFVAHHSTVIFATSVATQFAKGSH